MKKIMKLLLGVLILITFVGLFTISVDAATKRKLTKTDIKIVSPINKIYDGDYKHAIVFYKKGVTGKTLSRKYKALNGSKLTNKKPLNVGKYEETIIIKGTKKYKGKVKLKRKYTIKPRNIQKTDATITLPNNFQYDGNAKAVNVAFNHGMTGKIFISYSGNNLVNGKPIYPGIYKVRVTLQGTGNCKGSVTMDEVYYTIVDARAKNTSAIDAFVASKVPSDYANWTEFMAVVNSVKASATQYELESRITEVTGFSLVAKPVNTSIVDDYVSKLIDTSYTNWEDFIKVVNSVKAESLQSKFESRVSEVTGFELITKPVDTRVVDDYVASKESTDYSNWTEFMAVVSSVKAETLQSKFDERVTEVTEFELITKPVDTSVVDDYVASKESTDYSNWTEFMAVVSSVKAETLQSKFDARVSEVTGFTLIEKTMIKASDVSIKFPSNLVYDGDEKEIEVVPKPGVTAEIEVSYEGENLSNGKPVNAGDYIVNVTLKGTGNYGGTITLGQLVFTILKAKYDVANIKFSDKTFEYNPLMKYSIYVENSPVEVTYEGNEQSEKGTHEVIAHFNCEDPNYEPIEDMIAYIIIQENDDIGEGGQPGNGDIIEEGPQKPPASEDDDIIEEGEQKLPAAA